MRAQNSLAGLAGLIAGVLGFFVCFVVVLALRVDDRAALLLIPIAAVISELCVGLLVRRQIRRRQ